MFGKGIAWLWALILLLCGGLTVSMITSSGLMLKTDILDLLPDDRQDDTIRALRQVVSGRQGRNVLVLVGHEEPEAAGRAARFIGDRMGANPLFDQVRYRFEDTENELFQFYQPYAYQLGGHADLLKQPDPAQALLRNLEKELYRPTSAFTGRFLERDPLLFLPSLMISWSKAGPGLEPLDGLLGAEYGGKRYYLINATLAGSPFEREVQQALTDELDRTRTALLQIVHGGEVHISSVAGFAAATRSQMERDIKVIGIGSLLGIVVLILTTFRSMRYLLTAMVPLVLGLSMALGLCLFFFGEIHALTLAFGGSLIGICIDYSFHYFAHHRLAASWQPISAMRAIFPALGLGALTTLISYAALAAAPLGGLRQIALFSCVGIVVSLVTVVCWFPLWMRVSSPLAGNEPGLSRWSQAWPRLWRQRPKGIALLILVLLIPPMYGLTRLRIDDSPRALNKLPDDLVATERFIRQVMGTAEGGRFALVEGETAERVLQRLEQVAELSQTPAFRQAAEAFPNLSTFLPSKARQLANWRAFQTLAPYRTTLLEGLDELGFREDVRQNLAQALDRDEPEYLTPETWLQHPATRDLRALWLDRAEAGAGALIQFKSIKDSQGLKKLLDQVEGVHYFDPVQDFTAVLSRYRVKAMKMAGLAYVGIFLLLLWRYRAAGPLLFVPPFIAAAAALGVQGLIGVPLTFVQALALLLVLGMGIDYTIFLRESGRTRGGPALLALSLSALTTVLSFGLLGISQQAVLHAIGMTALVGIVFAWLLAPLALWRMK